MLENIKFILFLIVSFCLFYAVIRISMMSKKVEKKLEQVSNIKEFEKLYYKK